MQVFDSQYKSCLQCMRTIYREEGLVAFYRSYGTQLVMNLPFQSLHFMMYEFTQDLINKDRHYNPQSHMVSGAIAGAVAAAVTTPLDVCKTLLNMQEKCARMTSSGGAVSGLVDAFRTVYRFRGLRGYFIGIFGPAHFQEVWREVHDLDLRGNLSHGGHDFVGDARAVHAHAPHATEAGALEHLGNHREKFRLARARSANEGDPVVSFDRDEWVCGLGVQHHHRMSIGIHEEGRGERGIGQGASEIVHVFVPGKDAAVAAAKLERGLQPFPPRETALGSKHAAMIRVAGHSMQGKDEANVAAIARARTRGPNSCEFGYVSEFGEH